MARGDLDTDPPEHTHETPADVEDALHVFGLYAETPVPSAAAVSTFYLWPENVAAFVFWRNHLQTQWRTGMAGPDGLDYAGVWALLNNTVPQRRRRALFADITICEAGALEGFSQQRAEQPPG